MAIPAHQRTQANDGQAVDAVARHRIKLRKRSNRVRRWLACRDDVVGIHGTPSNETACWGVSTTCNSASRNQALPL